ncbi:DUF3899 domain-containing protein [Bacillus sp. FJAT-42376]|uniref:DUF3899 domain-containing protein n=1 Tax=Bacillus sp. FJAT-42376 TaxID=2014076 RepID=UPI000F4F5C5A|nr:DUF3899 domain-containing protein [Bacillus sp. FJAT-42376]AZB42357.1 DUF3899 domain-containing protein [Bacillus sp. FJAT-42376]
MKKSGIIFLSGLAVSLIGCLVYYKELSLLGMINSTFMVGGILLFVSLFGTVAQSGFFDAAAYGMRRTFRIQGKDMDKKEVDEMRPVSKLISFSVAPLLFASLALLGFMLIGLGLYYT